jgi:cyd operon protein YbgT
LNKPPRGPAAGRNAIYAGVATMWYFTWILGIGVALGFGIINVMWLEAEVFSRGDKRNGAPSPRPGGKVS